MAGVDQGLGEVDICGYLDGTLRRNCRPEKDEVQPELNDGHHRSHGLAYQAVQAPNGMILDAYGPAVGRRHDGYLLRISELNKHLAAIQGEPGAMQCNVYDDAAYPIRSHIRRGCKGGDLSDEQKDFNRAMYSMRTSVEWAFGKVVALYSYFDFRRSQKVLQQPVGRYYINAVILTDAQTCL